MSVYFMRQGRDIKIGKSRDPMARLKSLQTGSTMRIELLAVAKIDSDKESFDIERQLHERFGYARKHREFFRSDRVLCTLIAAVAAGMNVKDALLASRSDAEKKLRKLQSKVAWQQHTPPVKGGNTTSRRKARRLAEKMLAAAAKANTA